jgi:chromosome segregation ATPase
MKSVPIPIDELEELRALLAKAGLVKRDATLDFLRYEPSFSRRSAYRHTHYLVSSKQEAICHLITGTNLAGLHARAKDFSAACPKLACRPLLYHKGSGPSDYLCLEHFSGESLDVAVQSGRYSAADWLKAVRRAQHLLENTGQPSDQTCLEKEIVSLVNSACAFPGFSDVDARLLHELAKPALLEATAGAIPVRRWTTGDFVGRNLLVDAAGDIRLIDYEHAAQTHFGQADWLRLMQFSVLPPGLDPAAVTELNFADRPRHEVYLWLHHLSLLRDADPKGDTKQHIASTVQKLFTAIDRKLSPQPRSFLISSLIDGQIATETSLQQRTAWARSLETDLEKTRAALKVQTELVEERSRWGKSLEQELESARKNLEKSSAELAQRSAWAVSLDADLEKARAALKVQTESVEERSRWGKSLEQELESARKNLEKSSAELAERSAWALSVNADLEKARAALKVQTGLVEERSTWGKSLEQDLQAARKNLETLTAELAERTAWAKSLDTELGKARAALAAQTSRAEESSAWAQSLEHELHASRRNLEKLTIDYAERTAWAQSLDADLQELRTAHQEQVQQSARLGAELAAVDKACGALAALFPGSREWDRAGLLEHCLQALVDLHREVAAKTAAINAGSAATLRAQLDGEIAGSEAHRLGGALADAQLHVGGLLQHAARLQDCINLLQATKRETETALREKERLLNSSLADLQATRAELSRYEGRLICRLAARPPVFRAASKS